MPEPPQGAFPAFVLATSGGGAVAARVLFTEEERLLARAVGDDEAVCVVCVKAEKNG